ncbi:16S rRNA (cytidine(1402)-2'-O)-methyltransferase [Haploplasma axanthum]|nr:16S rRNA (cytidine(1402)-2'-O)-methyltransferase [Haploplasma axanthum]
MQVSFKDKKPTLFLVATPIGNLEDITFRAIETLKNVSVVFAEDTRTSGVLLKHYNIETKLSSYHEHEKFDKIANVLEYLNNGDDVALISDAGTPGISDPGYELVKAVIDNGYYVVSIPGAVASINALVSSGLLIQPHLFLGFLPRKQGEINTFLDKYKKVDATLIIYESPFRISKTLEYIYKCYGNRDVVLARELTKVYETIIRTDLETAISMEHSNKGEYIILISGYVEEETSETIESLFNKYLKDNIDEKEIFKLIAKDLNISKKDVYKKLKIDNKNL